MKQKYLTDGLGVSIFEPLNHLALAGSNIGHEQISKYKQFTINCISYCQSIPCSCPG